MAQKKRRRKKLDTSKLVCFLLVGSGLLITQECIYLMRLCIKSNYMASAAWLTAALSLAQVIICLLYTSGSMRTYLRSRKRRAS